MAVNKLPPIPIFVDDEGELEVIELEKTVEKQPDEIFNLLKSVIITNAKNIPQFITGNFLWFLPLVASWTILESISNFKIMTLPKPVGSLIMLLIFLTSSYNNFLAKGLYVIAVNRSIIPTIKSIKSEGFKNVSSRYFNVFRLIKKSYTSLKDKSLSVILTYLGISFIFSNLLTRNNKIDKYFITLILSFSLINSLYRGYGDLIIRIFRAIIKKFNKSKAVNHEYIYLSIGSMSLGFVSSIIFNFVRLTNSYYDYTGYVAGVILIIAGVLLNLRGKKVEAK